MLKFFILIFNRCFKPVIAIYVRNYTTLIKTVFTFKLRLYNK